MRRTYLLDLGEKKFLIDTQSKFSATLIQNIKFFCNLQESVEIIESKLVKVNWKDYVGFDVQYVELDEEMERFVYGYILSIGTLPFNYEFRTLTVTDELSCNLIVFAAQGMQKKQIVEWLVEYGVAYNTKMRLTAKITDNQHGKADGVYKVTLIFSFDVVGHDKKR